MMAGRKIILTPYTTKQGDFDLDYWQRSGNHKILERINRLVEASLSSPEAGIGKPEKLRFQDSEVYSRRIDSQHRLIYRVEGDKLVILSARFHYDDK